MRSTSGERRREPRGGRRRRRRGKGFCRTKGNGRKRRSGSGDHYHHRYRYQQQQQQQRPQKRRLLGLAPGGRPAGLGRPLRRRRAGSREGRGYRGLGGGPRAVRHDGEEVHGRRWRGEEAEGDGRVVDTAGSLRGRDGPDRAVEAGEEPGAAVEVPRLDPRPVEEAAPALPQLHRSARSRKGTGRHAV
ncbi:hypothetical protein GW17_00029609, partial [Ensete ventricosum]